MTTQLNRITAQPGINHGKPSIRNTRYSVESILEYLAAGDTYDHILNEFPDLQKEDILACIAFALACLKLKDVKVPVDKGR